LKILQKDKPERDRIFDFSKCQSYLWPQIISKQIDWKEIWKKDKKAKHFDIEKGTYTE
jgi:hypothetical protein